MEPSLVIGAVSPYDLRRTVTALTRREAVGRLRQLRRDADQGVVDADPRTTVAQWTRRWLEHVAHRRNVIGDLRPNTAGSYERLRGSTSSPSSEPSG